MLDGLLVVTFAVSSRQSSMADVKMRWAATTDRNLIRPLSKVQPVVAVGPVVRHLNRTGVELATQSVDERLNRGYTLSR